MMVAGGQPGLSGQDLDAVDGFFDGQAAAAVVEAFGKHLGKNRRHVLDDDHRRHIAREVHQQTADGLGAAG